MPCYDGTGPLGYGPMSGRGRGYCIVNYQRGMVQGRKGLGLGFGRGRCPGFGWRYSWIGDFKWQVEDEKNFLQNQARILKEQLKLISERLDQLDKGDNQED
ncbi:hypothetical protein BBF96_07860 [Anoxybacter fermentans]|uniref:DUF5320 domain-containing protein n=1 Tax=Anoxybacter fermentans TaxID=1323375 RepID=A0A3S9SYE1_9FIRM|nr:DUF5320 domain-containing protein [Anoxybacter fermentans]AZR73305.1 hypothetical protein BBF96_07860 [Anoxybacter fermentans]